MSGLAQAISSKSLPRLLKTSAVAALTCLALGHTSQQAQAQTKSFQPAAVQLGVPQLGPAPIYDVPVPDICWKPGTPASVIAAAERAHISKSGPTDSISSPFRVLGQGRWTRTATNGGGLQQGDPTTITYSIVPDGLIIPSRGDDVAAPSNLRARLNGIYGSQQVWLQLFAQIGAALSAQTGLTYVYEPNDDGAPFGTESPGQLGVRGDVRVSGRRVDGDEGGILAYNYAPNFGDMVIDTPDTFFNNTSGNSLGFRNTITHEFGHGLGLGHTCPLDETKLMEPIVTRRFDGPQLDDNLGLNRFYGDRLEGNDTIQTATPIGALANGTVSRPFLSIDGSTDADFFSFALPASRSLTVTVSPTGNSYLEGPQNGDGTCSAGELFDPKTVNDLGFELLAKNATTGAFTVVRTANDTGVGQAETLTTSGFPAGGDFAVRVFGGGINDAQLYNIDFAVGPPGTTPEPTPTPTAAPTPIRPVVDLNGANPDGSVGQNSPVANGIDVRSDYAEGGGAQVVAPATIVLADITKPDQINANQPGDNIVEARVAIAPFPEDPRDREPQPGEPGVNFKYRGAPDNNFEGKNNIEVLDVDQRTKDILSGKIFRPDGFKGNSGLTISYDANDQVLTIKGGITVKPTNVPNLQDYNRRSYEIALRGVTYENKVFNGNTNKDLDRSPITRGGLEDPDRFITYVVDRDNVANNNVDDRFDSRSRSDGPTANLVQSKIAVANLFIGEKGSLVVTTLEDSLDPQDQLTSLREAMNFANRDGKDSAITFAPGLVTRANPGTITLSATDANGNALGLPQLFDTNAPVTNNVRTVIKTSITGPGARLLNIDAGNTYRTFSTSTDDLTLSGLSISNAGSSGVLSFNGSLVVDACMISGSSGSGIVSFTSRPAPAGTFTVSNCAIVNNAGLGISSSNSNTGQNVKTTSVLNSTISGNRTGGVSIQSRAIDGFATPAQTPDATTIALSTIAGNTGIGVTAANNTIINISNTIVFGNSTDVAVAGETASGAGDGGRFITQNGNAVGTGNAVVLFNGADDTRGVDPLLDPLANNGGNTDTRRLAPTSPARNAGTATIPAPVPENDQRGAKFPRVFGGRVDKGAYEAQENNPTFAVELGPKDPAPMVGTQLTATATGNNDGTQINPLFYRFLIEGVEVQIGLSNQFTVPETYVDGNGATRFVAQGDRVTVIVAQNQANTRDALTPQATDFVLIGVGAGNTAPSITSVTFTPDSPRTNDKLTATITANDAENNDLFYTYEWRVNDPGDPAVTVTPVRVVQTTATSDTLDLAIGGNGDRGDTITLVVTATETQQDGLSSEPFQVQNANGEFVFPSVVVGNSAPTANNVSFNVAPGQTARVELTGTDPDANPATGQVDPLTFTIVTQGTQGEASIERTTDGRSFLVYKASPTATGQDTIVFRATDSEMAGSPAIPSANATAIATISAGTTPPPPPTPTPTPATNRPPVVVNTSLNAKREVPVSKGLAAFDPDATDPYSTLTLKRVGGPTKGTGEIRRDENGVWTLFYKASGLFSGNDEVRFVAIDDQGAVSNIGVITINLFNTAPTARSTSMQVAAGGSADVGIFGQDIDRDALTFKRVGGPSKGTGEIRRDENGNFRFYYQNSPAATGDDVVQFVALDGKPGGVSEVATINIKVIGFFNRAPSATNVSGTTQQGQAVTVPVAGTDPDEEDVLTFKRVGGPVNGTGDIRPDGVGGFAMFYTPRADFVGTETIRYVALDQKGRPSAPATITITVTASPAAASSKGSAPSAGSS